MPRVVGLRPDWRVTVIAGNRSWDDPSVVYPAAEEYRGVGIVRVSRPAVSRVNLVTRALGFAAFQRRAIRAARGMEGVDLVVGTTAPPLGAHIAGKVARLHGCPYVYVVLDLYPDLAATLGRITEGGLVCRRWHNRDTSAMRDAAAVVSIAERMTERIAKTRHLPGVRLRTIHDGFDPARVAPVDGGDFESRYNPEGRFVVQYAGNMGLSHPFDTILAAARMLGDESGILFQFIGDGPQRRGIQASLPPNARLIDYQPAGRLGQILGAADVCLISQHQEMFDKGLPYKIYATLAAGKASIFVGNGKSEIADWLEKSGAGRQVDQGEVEKLAGLLGDLASDRTRTDQMGRAARALFDERFNSQRAAERWVELIEEVIPAGG